jgi:tetratricopeptide (TPR) repeat protein/SAM-dependent methyltransferase
MGRGPDQRRTAGSARPNVAELFAAARAQHQSGHLGPAQSLYQQVLAADPAHFGSLYGLGILAIQAGQPRNAVDLLGRAVKRKDAPDVHYHLALAFALDRRAADATRHYRRAIALKPDYAEAHMNLGNVLTEQGQRDEAAACYTQVLELDPRSAIAHYNLANVLATLARPAEAERHFREAVACQPAFAEAWNNLGNLLRESGRGDDAEQAFRRALSLRPDFADAYSNLGVTLAARGALDDAIAQYRQALRLRPDLVAALNNLGLALSRGGDAEAAIVCFRRALAAQPDGLEALHHLARELFRFGDAAAAIHLLAPALDRNGSAETRSIFVHCVRALEDGELEGVRSHVLRALTEGWAPAGDLEQTCVRLIKHAPAMAACLAAAADGADDGGVDLAAIADDPMLRGLLVSGRVSDAGLERVLTIARRALLDRAGDAGPGSADHLSFVCALAQQCFLNEYVFAESAEEGGAVERLRAALAESLRAGGAVTPHVLIAVAAYRPLHALAGVEALLERSWPTPVDELLSMQVREPLTERAIRGELPALTPIEDAVSRAVQAQYEENPYPRWITPAPAVKPHRIDDYLREKFPLAPFRPMRLADGPDVLIAGCGTGSHPIEAQREFLDAHVLAIDLSRTSLAYAARKTRALGLPIEYAQADLLALDRIERRFDVIEACGSLHHLADPAAGWRVLLRRLKPGGVMLLGLYSRLARADLNAARAYIKERRYGGAADEIRRFRQEAFAWADGTPGKSIVHHGDFYSISGCRDLLFHVQEYQHDLVEIAGFIAEENLRFLGFELDARVAREYAAAHPDDPAMIDLNYWSQFEKANPSVFIRMYEFWVQKPAAA